MRASGEYLETEGRETTLNEVGSLWRKELGLKNWTFGEAGTQDQTPVPRHLCCVTLGESLPLLGFWLPCLTTVVCSRESVLGLF